MSRRPTSIEEHKRTGNYRESRHGKDGLPVERPEGYGFPGDPSATAIAAYSVMCNQAEFAGYLTRVDGFALRLGAEAWAEYQECQDLIQQRGRLIEQTNERGTKIVKNPACDMADKAWTKVLAILDRFGLSPRYRTSLSTNLPDTDDEEQLAQSIFGGSN